MAATNFPVGATKATLVGGTYTAVVTVTSLSMSGATREALETSSMDTATDRTFLAGDIQDAGEISWEGYYDGGTGVRDLHTALGAAEEAWTLKFQSTSTGTYLAQGFITSFELTGELEGVWTYSGTIKLTGAITITNV